MLKVDEEKLNKEERKFWIEKKNNENKISW